MMPKDVYFPAVRVYGVTHFLSKEASQEEISATLSTFVLDTQPVREIYDPPRPQRSPEHKDGSAAKEENPFTRLTSRELEVLHHLLRGDQVVHISQSMNLHKNTVSTVKARLMQKLKTNTILELFELALAHRMSF